MTIAAVDGMPAEGEPVSRFYIPSASVPTTQGSHVLKHGDCFAVLDSFGDAQATSPAAEGLFFDDTRHLSRLVLTVDGMRPLLLSSTMSEDNSRLAIDLTNPDLMEGGTRRLAQGAVHILRRIVLGEDALFHSVELHNFGVGAVVFELGLDFAADFVDIFELRGSMRQRRGRLLSDDRQSGTLVLSYLGLDHAVRRTLFNFSPPVEIVAPRRAIWAIALPRGGRRVIRLSVRCENREHLSSGASLDATEAAIKKRTDDRKARSAGLHTDNEAFNAVLDRSRADLDMLITQTPQGIYPYAGIPWFSTAFGRDGLITALECLWLDPAIAAGTLRFLAARQATQRNPEIDAEPGKILHETRRGEMAILGEVPFGNYYGGVDTTPLFVVVAAAYYARTGDLDLIRAIWSNIEAALAWMAEDGDVERNGLLEYESKSTNGLTNQGWKDSGDAIFHADGHLAEPPIALAEVQSYAYAAYRGAAALATALGENRTASELVDRATRLKQRFEAAFWIDEINTYALAIDGTKRACRVRSSNAGHVLLSGLASRDRAARVAQTLMAPESFSSWGIRTVAETEARYNPMSYHNGSVWPHDTALIAMGFGRYGLKQPVLRLLTGLFDAARFMERMRLPELFCGFARRPGSGPTAYPVACAPQAWSSASIFAILGAALGISFDPPRRRICFTSPALPSWLDTIRLSNLRLGEGSADLLLLRTDDGVAVHVERRDGPLEILLTT